MNVPRSWWKAEGQLERAGERKALAVWGWGEDEAAARVRAGERLRRLLTRMGGEGSERATAPDDEYEYAARPLREEILQTLGAGAVLTRNRYGSVVLNTAGLLVLDVDLPPARGFQWLGRLFGRRDPLEPALDRLREGLRAAAPASTFRLYRTAAGLRALALDREFDPAADETRALMERTGTDPAFTRLCRLQQSFRARLTPKPWRCGCPNPPGEYPRVAELGARFSGWCERYAAAIAGHATCRFLETVGTRAALPEFAPMLELHDRATRCTEALPLA